MEQNPVNKEIESSYENIEDLCSSIEHLKGEYDEAIVILTGTTSPAYDGGRKTHFIARLRQIAAVIMFYESVREGRSPIIITSGGFRNEDSTEDFIDMTQIMKKELVGWYEIPEDKIIIEGFSFDTSTNAKNISKVLDTLGFIDNGEVKVVTNQFHLKRSIHFFKRYYEGEISATSAEEIIITHDRENEKYLLPGDDVKRPYREFVRRFTNSFLNKKLALTDFVLMTISKMPKGEEFLTELAEYLRISKENN